MSVSVELLVLLVDDIVIQIYGRRVWRFSAADPKVTQMDIILGQFHPFPNLTTYFPNTDFNITFPYPWPPKYLVSNSFLLWV